MKTQVCFKCQQCLPLSEFYRHPAMTSGVIGKCKICTKADVQRNYRANREVKRQYDKHRQQTPERRARKLEYQRSYRARHPDRYQAHVKLNRAVRLGLVKRLPCRVCGSSRSEGHHRDYSKPLEVDWLCLMHHRQTEGRLCQ